MYECFGCKGQFEDHKLHWFDGEPVCQEYPHCIGAGKSPQDGSEAGSEFMKLLSGIKSQHVRNGINDMVARLQDSLDKDASGEWKLIDEARQDYQHDLKILEQLAT